MSESGLWPIQQAVHARLIADVTLMAKVTGVFDGVPAQQPFPYVIVGDATEMPDNAHNQDGHDTTLTIRIASRYEGFKEALSIAQRIDVLLDDQLLVVTGWGSIKTQREFRETMRDTDGVTRHVVQRYRVGLFATA